MIQFLVSKETIDLALKNGWEVDVRYIQRPIEEVTMGVIQRADESGRWFPIRNLAQAHVDAQKSVVELSKMYRNEPRVRFNYRYKFGRELEYPSLKEIDENGRLNYIKDDEREWRTGLERGGRSGRRRGIEASALKRGSAETFRRAIKSREYEPEILEKLARGDEEFQRLIEEAYGPKEKGVVPQSPKKDDAWLPGEPRTEEKAAAVPEQASEMERPPRVPPEKLKDLPPLRRDYIQETERLWDLAKSQIDSGADEETVARKIHGMRDSLKFKYKDLTPPDLLAKIKQRNLAKYGNADGPTIEWLRAHGKSWRQIIESACRTGGNDLGF